MNTKFKFGLKAIAFAGLIGFTSTVAPQVARAEVAPQVARAEATPQVARAVAAPDCLDRSGRVLPIDNAKVSQLKQTSKNQYRERAHISGTLTQVYSGNKGHETFEVTMDSTSGDKIEVIYNIEFGDLPTLTPGAKVQACGDYITARERAGRYPPSPNGAVLHWVHRSPNEARHPSGFLLIDGKLYGQD